MSITPFLFTGIIWSLLEAAKTAKCSIELIIIVSKLLKSKLIASVAELVNITFSLFVFINSAMLALAHSIIFLPFLP